MKLAILMFAASLALPAQVAFRRAPGFSLPDAQQKQHDLADYRGKIVLLDIMRTDCPHCQELTKLLEDAKSKYGPDKVQVLSVVTMPDDLQKVRSYIKQFSVTSPILFDCGQMIASYVRLTPQNRGLDLPVLFVIDKSGFIRTELRDKAITGPAVLGAVEAATR